MTPKENFFKHQAQTSPYPLGIEIDRAKGSYVYDTDGNGYLDFISGIAVANMGHGHPKIVEATVAQVQKHMHVMAYGEFIQTAQVAFAARLAQLLPPQLQSTYFVNSGAEAVEGALKLAKRITGRHKLMSFEKSYHGSTHGALSVTGNETKKYRYRPLLPGVQFIRFNNEDDLNRIDSSYAGVIVETIQGDAGVRIPSLTFMKKLRQVCSQHGVMLILDEIQTGMGRTGKLFAFEHFGIEPDILVLGKALGGGMHLGAFISSAQHMALLKADPILGHITTFGGHPVACAAGLAALNAMIDEGHLEECEQKGTYFQSKLQSPHIVEIRRKGLMFAIEMADANVVQQVVQYCLSKHLITFWFLSCPESFRLAPPLVVTYEELDAAAAIINEAMTAIQST
ncbi:MAG TPA: aspartate aminotransferase family protein [Luteibaculaceae bacterium]|nr:aspartate aminotransferase family protein [Luteibaculaceae bacterium]